MPFQPSLTLQSSPDVVLPAFSRLAQSVQVSMEKVTAPLRVLSRSLAGAYNDPVYVEGMKARYAVRAALDPAWVDPLSPLRLLNPSPETWEDIAGMSRADRIEVAVAALRAHALHRPARARYACTFGGTVQHHVVRQHIFSLRAPQERTVTT